jgi:diadenylate cyclase
MLWMAVAREASSEIGLEVPLEYHNIPPNLEIAGESADIVQVRLRGPSNVIKDITARSVATAIDLTNMQTGEKVVALSPQNVQAPFGAEVVRVNPSTVRFSLERTIVKSVPIAPTLLGQPASGYEIGKVAVEPASVRVEGPERRLNMLAAVPTVPIRLEGKKAAFEETVELDVSDAQVRLEHASLVRVRIDVYRK